MASNLGSISSAASAKASSKNATMKTTIGSAGRRPEVYRPFPKLAQDRDDVIKALICRTWEARNPTGRYLGTEPATANDCHYRCNFKLEPQKSNSLNQNRTYPSLDSISHSPQGLANPQSNCNEPLPDFLNLIPDLMSETLKRRRWTPSQMLCPVRGSEIASMANLLESQL